MSYALLRTEMERDPLTREWVPTTARLLPDAVDVTLSGKRVRLEEIEITETEK